MGVVVLKLEFDELLVPVYFFNQNILDSILTRRKLLTTYFLT